MSNILIVHSSKRNQTKKIASYIADRMRKIGHRVDESGPNKIIPESEWEKYDGIILGAPVYGGRYPSDFRKWIKKNTSRLAQKPTAFFSVCLGILQKDQHVQNEERRIVEQFFTDNNWYPLLWSIFAGALSYSRYNWFLKPFMRHIARLAGQATVSTKDYEFTDWREVDKFAHDFLLVIGTEYDYRSLPPVQAGRV